MTATAHRMGIPGKIRIIPDDYYFPYVGTLSDGSQFMAYATGAFPHDNQYPSPESNWRDEKQWLAVLHLFNADGSHRQTISELGGCDNIGREKAQDEANEILEDFIAALYEKDAMVGDIWVKLFKVEIDGVVHGLIFEKDDQDEESEGYVMLEPRDIMFHPPWDSGEYSS